jgi:hypothetical protein
MKWSNAQVEGQVHSLKLIKREMYGRASFNLLRARVPPYVSVAGPDAQPSPQCTELAGELAKGNAPDVKRNGMRVGKCRLMVNVRIWANVLIDVWMRPIGSGTVSPRCARAWRFSRRPF